MFNKTDPMRIKLHNGGITFMFVHLITCNTLPILNGIQVELLEKPNHVVTLISNIIPKRGCTEFWEQPGIPCVFWISYECKKN